MSDIKHRCGLFAFSADPIHFGHIAIIAEAARACRELVVLVAENERKRDTYLFPLMTRAAMVRNALLQAGISNTRIVATGGLLIDVYLREGCDHLFRGIRNAADRAAEKELASLNELILPAIHGQVTQIKAKPELKLVSSSMVKEFVRHRLDVDRFVPISVKQALEERILGQYRVAVTGGIAVGKSRVAQDLCEHSRAFGIEAVHINVDALLRRLYVEDSPGAQQVRESLAERFGRDVLTADGRTVDRPALKRRMFAEGGKDAFVFAEHLTKPHVARKYREALASAKGLVILEWSQIAEMNMSGWTNNNVIVVSSPDRERFAAARGLTAEHLADAARVQCSPKMAARLINKRVAEDGHGKVLEYQNLFRESSTEMSDAIALLLDCTLDMFPALRK